MPRQNQAESLWKSQKDMTAAAKVWHSALKEKKKKKKVVSAYLPVPSQF